MGWNGGSGNFNASYHKYATYQGFTPTFGTYTNDTGTRQQIQSVSFSGGCGSGSFTAGASCYGNGAAFGFYVSINGIGSGYESVGNACSPTDSPSYPSSSNFQTHIVYFGSPVYVAPGQTVSIVWTANDYMSSNNVLCWSTYSLSGSVVSAPDSHTVTFVDWNGSVISSQTVSDGGNASAPANPSRTGYNFAGWSGSYTGVTSDRTITATYSLAQYTITLNAQGGSVSPTSMTVTYSQAIGGIPTPSRPAYSFAGWFTGTGGSGSQYTSSTIYPYTSGMTLYAYWTPITYSATYYAQDATDSPAVMPSNRTTYNVISSSVTLNNPTRIGYTFTGWTGSNGATPQTSVTVDTGTYGNLVYYANWRAQLEEDSGGTWAHGAVAYKFDGSNWYAVDTKSFNGSTWNRLP